MPSKPFSWKTVRHAQGLLETTIAIFILVTGVIALFALVMTASIVRTMSEYQSVASNLAREGLEAVRNVRDRNWFSGSAFDAGLVGGGNDYTFSAMFNPATNAMTLSSNPNAITDTQALVYQYTSGAYTGVYTQTSPQPAGTSFTLFRRLLTLDSICSDGTIRTAGAACPGSPYKVGIRATATVRWTERGRTHVISAEQRLYDWR